MDSVEVVYEKIRTGDKFGLHNGLELIAIKEGYAQTRMTVGEHSLNAENITHGAAIFGLADLALAAAANSYGQVAVLLNMNISLVKATYQGAVLLATATEDHLTNRTGLYRIKVEDETGDIVAIAEGVVFRKK